MLKNAMIIILMVTSTAQLWAQTYEYKIVTSIESVVPMGVGRSRILSSDEEKNFKDYTTFRTEDNKKQNKSR